MILPVSAYCGVLQMNLPEAKMKQLIAFQERCIRIVYDSDKNSDGLPSVMNTKKIEYANS